MYPTITLPLIVASNLHTVPSDSECTHTLRKSFQCPLSTFPPSMDPRYRRIPSRNATRISHTYITSAIPREILAIKLAYDEHITCVTAIAPPKSDLMLSLLPHSSYHSTVLPRDYLGVGLLTGLSVAPYSNPAT